MMKKRILINGPFLEGKNFFYGGGIGGIARSVMVYLEGFKSDEVELRHCPHSVRKAGRLFFVAFPFRLVGDMFRVFVQGLRASGIHILGQYRTAIFREFGIVCVCRIIRLPVLYDIKAGALIKWHESASLFSRSLFRFIIGSSRVILCEGVPYIDFLRNRFNQESHYFPNFVLSSTVPQLVPQRLVEKTIKVLFVGFCYEGKGVFELVKGCKLAVDKGVPVELSLVGQEAEDFKDFLDGYLPKHPQLQVNRVGKLPPDKVHTVYDHHDVFCMASRHPGEGHTNTINEAMMTGSVIIATHHGFLDSVLTDDCAYFLNELSPQKIATTLMQINNDRDGARLKASNARNRLIQHYTSDTYFEKLSRYYSTLLNSTTE